MHKRLQDALTLTSRFRRPDLFITMTANPKWSDIQDQLPTGFSRQSRPDIVNRVVHQKKKKLIKLIEKDQVFGKMRAYTYTIEFQKRGLPHCHLLVFLEWPSRETITPSFLDDVISAEIPPITSPVRELVITQMMHGPCGSLSPNSPCMIDGKCDKNYPKGFSNETIVEDIDGYPKYRQRSPQDGGGEFMKTRPNQTNWCEMDNRNVIPYTAFRLKTLNCHINVEYCSSIKSIQYLFKYQYKRNDQATMQIIQQEHNHDEVQRFLNTRYVSSMEATWRIFNFDICAVKPSVLQLTFHLPEEQTVTFFHGMDSAMSALSKNEHTQLTRYFEMNLLNPTAKETFYSDFPEKFTWNPSKKIGLYDKEHTIHRNLNKLDESSVYTQTTVNFFAYDNYFCIERGAPVLKNFKLLMENFVLLSRQPVLLCI